MSFPSVLKIVHTTPCGAKENNSKKIVTRNKKMEP